jgi:GNAT superfamily N-acetyltransferase
MEIRAATHSDAEEGSLVLRRSIQELCHEDHGGDPAIIAGWIGNKTAAMWHAWVDQAASRLFVAVEAGRILGVGMMDAKGEIMLNYVSPDARLRGVSKALLGHMEAEACRLGVMECRLESTRTARRFYRSAGYITCEGASESDEKMTKPLDR